VPGTRAGIDGAKATDLDVTYRIREWVVGIVGGNGKTGGVVKRGWRALCERPVVLSRELGKDLQAVTEALVREQQETRPLCFRRDQVERTVVEKAVCTAGPIGRTAWVNPGFAAVRQQRIEHDKAAGKRPR